MRASRRISPVCTSTTLRGSGSTWASIAGATLPDLMHRLGHKTPTAAMRYRHATSETHRKVADRLASLSEPFNIFPAHAWCRRTEHQLSAHTTHSPSRMTVRPARSSPSLQTWMRFGPSTRYT